MTESTELCNYILSEVFRYVADDRKRQFEQLSTIPVQPVQNSVEKMAGKILKRMKKDRSESIPPVRSKKKNAELSFGKKGAILEQQ